MPETPLYNPLLKDFNSLLIKINYNIINLYPSQSIPKITALSPEATAVPLVCVLAATGIKDAVDDFVSLEHFYLFHVAYGAYTLHANMADHSVIAGDELHESEASEASVFCFDNASPEKSCFVNGLVCFILLCLQVFEFLNATRRE